MYKFIERLRHSLMFIIIALVVLIFVTSTYGNTPYMKNQSTMVYNNDKFIATSQESLDPDVTKDTTLEYVQTNSLLEFDNEYSNNELTDIDDIQDTTQGFEVTIDDNVFYIAEEALLKESIDSIYAAILPDSAYSSYLNFGQVPAFSIGDYTFENTYIESDISVKEGKYPASRMLDTVDQVRLNILHNVDNLNYHAVSDSDTLESIAKEYDITTSTLKVNNSLSEDTLLYENQKLIVSELNPIIDFTFNYKRTVTEDVEYANVEQSTDTLFKNQSELIREGENGVQEVFYRGRFTNNDLDFESIDSIVSVKPAISQVTLVGSVELPGVGTGTFIWPTTCYTITNGFGGADLSGFGIGHLALDIACNYGAEEYASDNGVVTQASFSNYGGGYEVIIDHQNGFETKYSHMNGPPAVIVGEKVAKGQVIGHMGNTGNVTGTHIHFEVILNGQRVDPLSYL